MLSHYKDDPRVAFVVHGFKTEHLERFLKIKDALFNITDIAKRPDVVTIVDWRLMAKFKTSDIFAGYKKAARNAELVGQEIAHALYLLSVHRKLNPDKVHLIGFSLGAQVVGMAGRKAVMAYSLAKVGRITGLDPAGPRFEDFTGHLNRDDAHFVDIIHTNAGNSWFTLKMGMSKSVGHVDFYPNGGSKQPGCTRSFKDISCSHNMAVKLFEASISAADQCKFHAMKCPKWADYENGDMTKCTQELVPMGFYSNTVNSQGTFYLKTTAQYPYC
ncbi:Pancreatic lipase-related protein 2 [Halotydeus destructor]|nr:Pancreatic lipase-related protein 2 [Halotydeus destructor]